ncbi:MAG: beta-galactosidase [Victivallales bacterium]
MISFNNNSYVIDGKPEWLLSGEVHYFKLTRGEWRKRLLQQKCAGFNAVSVYMPWNYHEIEEGSFDFAGHRDVEYFLSLAAEIGLYVVARPGPYICNEWQAGGLPPWLTRKKGLRPRTADKKYLDCVDKWFDKICPIIEKFQVGKGGTVIMCQIENEYGHYGKFQEEKYIQHLRRKVLEHNIHVPIINCDSFINFARLQPRKYKGVNLCCNFGGDGLRNLERARKLQPEAPLFVTEYWIAAFDWWGRNGSAVYKDQSSLNGALEIAAGGAGGLTAFVFSGGAHFSYWHGCSICSDANFMTTLYGPGAPILDDGLFSPKYQLFKNFMSPLVSAELAGAGMPVVQEINPGVLKAVRKGKTAEFTFIINHSKEKIEIADKEKDQACVDMSIPAGAVKWSVKNLPLKDGIVLNETNLDIFCSEPALILFGEPGKDGFAVIDSERIEIKIPAGENPFHRKFKNLDLIVLNNASVCKCWKLALPGAETAIFGGPDRIEDAKATDNSLALKTSSSSKNSFWSLKNGEIKSFTPEFKDKFSYSEIFLGDIKCSNEFPESVKVYDDSAWHSSKQPEPMQFFGNGHGRAWYRTSFKVKQTGPQMICFSGASDRALVWVDGNYVGVRGVHSHLGWNVMPSLEKGEHVISILAENLGMFNSGAEFDIPLCEPKGIFGPVWLNGCEIRNWRMSPGTAANETFDVWQSPGPVSQKWETPDSSDLKGPLWVKGTLKLDEIPEAAFRLEFGENAGKGTVWVNGFNVGRYWNLGPQQSLWIPRELLKSINEIVILEELKITPLKIHLDIKAFGYSSEIRV